MSPYFDLLSTAWRYARQEKGRYVLLYAMFMVANTIEALQPMVWGLFINKVQQDSDHLLSWAWMYIAALFGIHFSFWALHGSARVMERQLAFNLSRNFLAELYHKALHLPVQWHQDHHSGETINRVRKAYEALKSFFDQGFMFLHAIAKFVFSFAAMLYFSPLFGGIAVLLGVVAVLVIVRFDKPFMEALHETNEREHKVSSALFDSLSNIITVITLRLERRMESRVGEQVQHVFPPFRRKVFINEWKWFTVDTIVAIIYATILLGYLYQHWQPGQVFLIGGLVALITYVDRFTSVFHDIAWQYTEVVSYHTDVCAADTVVLAYANQHRPDQPAPLPANWRVMDIDHLTFTHHVGAAQGDYVPGLFDLSLKFKRGSRVALIGASGSGKSTLLAVLRGLYDPQPDVQLRIDGSASPDWHAVGNHVTLFPQEPEIFENTIEYNITLGLPIPDAEVAEACRVARFEEVIHQLPKGLQAHIAEKGVNLSGGQKQRLALARGILAARESDLLLFDEPTSSVDPQTERTIYEQLFRQFSDKAVVSALHRLHLLPLFDYIYVMDNGRVVAEGSYADLKERHPEKLVT